LLELLQETLAKVLALDELVTHVARVRCCDLPSKVREIIVQHGPKRGDLLVVKLETHRTLLSG
jgi:hypothetical protein